MVHSESEKLPLLLNVSKARSRTKPLPIAEYSSRASFGEGNVIQDLSLRYRITILNYIFLNPNLKVAVLNTRVGTHCNLKQKCRETMMRSASNVAVTLYPLKKKTL